MRTAISKSVPELCDDATYQIFIIARDGSTTPGTVLPGRQARAFVETFNTASRSSGNRAEAREVEVAEVRPWGRFPEKFVTVAIYQNGILSRVVDRHKPLRHAMQFCEHFNWLNRSTDLVATFWPEAK